MQLQVNLSEKIAQWAAAHALQCGESTDDYLERLIAQDYLLDTQVEAHHTLLERNLLAALDSGMSEPLNEQVWTQLRTDIFTPDQA